MVRCNNKVQSIDFHLTKSKKCNVVINDTKKLTDKCWTQIFKGQNYKLTNVGHKFNKGKLNS